MRQDRSADRLADVCMDLRRAPQGSFAVTSEPDPPAPDRIHALVASTHPSGITTAKSTRPRERISDMSEAVGKAILYSLRVSGLKLADPTDDIRGRTVIARDGQKIGFVDDLLLDDHNSRIRFVQIAHSGILGISRDHFMVPVNSVTRIEDRYIHITLTKEDVEREPLYQPDLVQGTDTGGQGWWEQGPDGLPGVAVQ
jgi:sporulation protein YlmC with PRC-barrel domain